MDRQEWDRAVAFEAFEKERNRNVPPLKLAANTDSWIKEAAAKELLLREFLEKRGILTVPNWVQHYTLRPMPPYLHALEGFGETDDFSSPSRIKDNCIRYVDPPSEHLGYFWQATAEDPQPITVHEGIPGHYFQLCLSWKHEDPIRRHYYDSGANEGIGFYAEEMMLQAGLFDDSPHTREIIYNFMRLRALRVEVDVKLALGHFSLEQAAKYLHEKVPMDEQTARQEAIAFSTGPGQAITYQVGKLQIMKFLAEARMQQGDKSNLRTFHDFVWKSGIVATGEECLARGTVDALASGHGDGDQPPEEGVPYQPTRDEEVERKSAKPKEAAVKESLAAVAIGIVRQRNDA